MTKFYQILNPDFQPVRTFNDHAEAMAYAKQLQTMNGGAYSDEAFYIVELSVVDTFLGTPKT